VNFRKIFASTFNLNLFLRRDFGFSVIDVFVPSTAKGAALVVPSGLCKDFRVEWKDMQTFKYPEHVQSKWRCVVSPGLASGELLGVACHDLR